MFVRESKYREALISAKVWELKLQKLNREWNQLVRRINKLGGEQFLESGKASAAQAQFSADDIQRLLMLCHPDKHDGKQMATDMTAKLLKLKEQMK